MKQAYQIVADDILMRIRRGEWRRGDKVPAIRALESLYPHSRMTLHKALRHLVSSGYLNTRRGRGTFVRATHIRDRVGILAGGITGGYDRAPLTAACLDFACAYFNRCGMEARVYSEDSLSATRLPAALNEDLDAKRLKGLLTIQSSFPYRHMRTSEWRQHAVPHVDIGSLPAPHRVYADFPLFVERALEVVRREGRQRPLLVAKGAAQELEALLPQSPAVPLRIYNPPMDGDAPMGHEAWGFRIMLDLCRKREAFDALIVPDDTVAKGLAQGALACGMDIPRDCLIVLLANHGIEIFYPVPVFRLDVDVEAIVFGAGDLLLRLIVDPALPEETILVPPDRESWVGVGSPGPVSAATRGEVRRRTERRTAVLQLEPTGTGTP